MMVLGYFLGQKYYPIPYNLRKFFGYIGLALGLYFISRFIQTESWLINVGTGLILLAAYATVVLLIEKLRFSKLF
jgi:hypothetical protein